MPITLEKLLSPTAETSFEFLGETVHVTFAPMRYTGEMQDFAQRLSDEQSVERDAIADLREQADELIKQAAKGNTGDLDRARAAELRANAENREVQLGLRDRKALRDSLASNGDGNGGPPGLLVAWDVMEGRKPLPTDRKTIDRLPDLFLQILFLNLARENQPDPQKAPTSDEP